MSSIDQRLPALIALLAGCALTWPCAAADPPTYSAVDLGVVTRDGEFADAASIDDSGQIAGSVYTGQKLEYGFVLPRVGGDVRKLRIGKNQVTVVSAITSTGLVGGSTSLKGRRYDAFIADSHGRHAQVLEAPWADTVFLYGLNRYGEGIGEAYVKSENTSHAIITRPGHKSVIDLGNAPSEGMAINDHGQATGWMIVGNMYKVFLSDRQGHVRDIGLAGFGYGINDKAQIVGITAGGVFITGPDGRDPKNLGDLGGPSCETQLNAINDRGQAVGAGCIAGRDTQVAVVTDLEGTQLYQLEQLVRPQGVLLATARAINSQGKIVADGVDGHCYLLTPD